MDGGGSLGPACDGCDVAMDGKLKISDAIDGAPGEDAVLYWSRNRDGVLRGPVLISQA